MYQDSAQLAARCTQRRQERRRVRHRHRRQGAHQVGALRRDQPRRRPRPSRGRPGAPGRRPGRSARRRRRRAAAAGSRGAAAGGRPASSRAGRAPGCGSPRRAASGATSRQDVGALGEAVQQHDGSPSSGPSSRTSKASPSRCDGSVGSAVSHRHVHQRRRPRASGTPAGSRDLDDRVLAAHARRPPARPPRPAGCRVVGRRAAAGSAPATTIVTSPRTPVGGPGDELGRAAPRRTSSWVLVSSRHTARRRGRRRTPRPSRPARPRCGAAPRRTPSSAARRPAPASRRDRSPALRGRKPSKQNRSTGSPETASAVSTADGPGHRGDRGRRPRPRPPPAGSRGRRRSACRRRSPARTRSPGEQRLEQRGGARRLVALEVGHHPAARP